VAFKFLNVLVLNKAEKLPTKNLIEPKLYMNPTKNLIEPKPLFKTRTFKNLNATGKVMGRDR
jgi:hypothetical protein